MPTNRECVEACNIMVEAGYQVEPHMVRQVFNQWNAKVFVAFVKNDGCMGLVIYAPGLGNEALKYTAF